MRRPNTKSGPTSLNCASRQGSRPRAGQGTRRLARLTCTGGDCPANVWQTLCRIRYAAGVGSVRVWGLDSRTYRQEAPTQGSFGGHEFSRGHCGPPLLGNAFSLQCGRGSAKPWSESDQLRGWRPRWGPNVRRSRPSERPRRWLFGPGSSWHEFCICQALGGCHRQLPVARHRTALAKQGKGREQWWGRFCTRVGTEREG